MGEFKAMPEQNDAERLAEILEDKDTKIDIRGANGVALRLCNDTLSKCKLTVTRVSVRDGDDISTTFAVQAVNGKILQ